MQQLRKSSRPARQPGVTAQGPIKMIVPACVRHRLSHGSDQIHVGIHRPGACDRDKRMLGVCLVGLWYGRKKRGCCSSGAGPLQTRDENQVQC